MSTPEKPAEPAEPVELSIGTLSSATGVPVDTLRTWERRYGFPAPVTRTGGSHRRYSVDTSKVRALGWTPAHGFSDALGLTVDWYLGHEDWWRPLKSGEYLDYYRRQYGDRLAAGAAVE